MQPNGDTGVTYDVEPSSGEPEGTPVGPAPQYVPAGYVVPISQAHIEAMKPATSRGWKIYLWIMFILIMGPFGFLAAIWAWAAVTQGQYAGMTIFLYSAMLWPLLLAALLLAVIHSIALITGLVRKGFVGGWKGFAITSLVLSLVISAYGAFMAVSLMMVMSSMRSSAEEQSQIQGTYSQSQIETSYGQ